MTNPASVSARDDANVVHLKDLIFLAGQHKKILSLVFLLGVTSAGATLFVPRYATQFFRNGQFTLPGGYTITGLVLLILLSGILSMFQYYYLQKAGEDIVRDSRTSLATRLLRLPIEEYDQRGTGDLLSRLNNDASRLKNAYLQGFTALASGSVLIIGSLIYMAFIDPVLFVTAFLVLAAALCLMLLTSKFVQKTSLSNQRTLGDLTSRVTRDLAGVRSIRSANAVQSETTTIAEKIRKVWQSGLQMAKVQAVINPLSNIALQLAALIVLGVGLWRVTSGELTVEGLTQFIMLLFILISPLSQVMYASSQIGESLAALSRIREITSIPEESANDEVTAQLCASGSNPATPAVEFHDVSFSYRSSTTDTDQEPQKTLHGLTFSVPRHRMMALVGPSGAGKSTVLQLIERFYEPAQGVISVLGHNIAMCDREELRTHLAYVEQDSPALSGTLRENLLLGISGKTDEECRQMLENVQLSHLLSRSTQGLDLQIGENGVALSGGERQRLAIARALLSSAEIVLLDEATANLDSRSEQLVIQLLQSSKEKRTVIVVAHRLATVLDADQIFVIEHGRIVGSGTHEQLLKQVPLYRELAKEQHLA